MPDIVGGKVFGGHERGGTSKAGKRMQWFSQFAPSILVRARQEGQVGLP